MQVTTMSESTTVAVTTSSMPGSMELNGKEESDQPKELAFSELPAVTEEALTTFDNLPANLYLGQATGKTIASEESMACDCRYTPGVDDPSAACGNDHFCINRMMYMECTEKDCACGRHCRNRRFQLREYAHVDVVKTKHKGYGLRALSDLPQNAFVIEYIGEVITQKEFIRRTKQYQEEGITHYYSMTLKNDEIIDATKKGCLARFANHSCKPNCATQKWLVNGLMRVGLFARRPIKAGEEITFDYQFERFGAFSQVCYCGQDNCAGIIGGVTREKLEEDMMTVLPSDDDDDDGRKKGSKRRSRKRGPRLIKNEDDVQEFLVKMLDSQGKLALVDKLLLTLELTLGAAETPKEVKRTFVRLHGLRLIRLWLGEWKKNDDVVSKVLHCLKLMPLMSRNGVEDVGLLATVEKLKDSENQAIASLSAELVQNWSQLKRVYHIPKRTPTATPVEKSPTEEVKKEEPEAEPSKRSASPGGRDTPANSAPYGDSPYGDPSQRYSPYGKNVYRPQDQRYDARSADYRSNEYRPDAYRANEHRSNNYRLYERSNTYRPNEHREYDPRPSEHPRYDRAWDRPPRPPRYYDDRQGRPSPRKYDTERDPPRRPPSYEREALSGDWERVNRDGQVYYHNKVTHKTQWEPPKTKASTIEGVDQHVIEDIIRQASESKTKPQTPRQQPSPATSQKNSIVSHSSQDEAVIKYKEQVSKYVAHCLTHKHKHLWDSKPFFKSLNRRVTHHIVDRERSMGRKQWELSDSMRTKIEKFLTDYGAKFASDIRHKEESMRKSSEDQGGRSPKRVRP